MLLGAPKLRPASLCIPPCCCTHRKLLAAGLVGGLGPASGGAGKGGGHASVQARDSDAGGAWPDSTTGAAAEEAVHEVKGGH